MKCNECEHAKFYPGEGKLGRSYCRYDGIGNEHVICQSKPSASTSPNWCPIKKIRKSFDKEKFLTSAMGKHLECMIKLWDEHLDKKMAILSGISDCKDPELELKIAFMIIDKCVHQWEVYRLMFQQIYGIDYHFTRMDNEDDADYECEYFGICTEDEADWLYKFYKL